MRGQHYRCGSLDVHGKSGNRREPISPFSFSSLNRKGGREPPWPTCSARTTIGCGGSNIRNVAYDPIYLSVEIPMSKFLLSSTKKYESGWYSLDLMDPRSTQQHRAPYIGIMAGVAYKDFRELIDVGDRIEMLIKAEKLSIGEGENNGNKKRVPPWKKENEASWTLHRELFWGYKVRVKVLLNLGVIEVQKGESNGKEVDMVEKVTFRVPLLKDSGPERVTHRVRKLKPFSYESTHTVPWSYEVKVEAVGEPPETQMSNAVIASGIAKNGRCYVPPEGEARKIGKNVGDNNSPIEEVIEKE
ncbi:hypothetical protein Lal_00039290 [Lupinus albus]|nr:hypothetical protein Lal_00039290 [Lupinus albus]